MADCIFCKISRSEVPSYKVYEDNFIFAFLDVHPINRGHVLVIPKRHEPNFHDLDESIYSDLMLIVRKVANRVNEIVKPKRVGLIVAGFDVPHTHVHVVPMNDYHDITSKSVIENRRANPTENELAETAGLLRM